jgi:hypothetical protein
MTNKIHNKTLFVAALSVYFGLLIVGAPPHVLAQQIEAQTKQSNSEVKLNRKPFDDFARELKQLISVGEVDLNNSCSISIKATLENDGKLKGARVVNKIGDVALCRTAVNFISATSDSGVLVYLRQLQLQPSGEITITLDAEKGNFNLTNALSIENAQRAQNLASALNSAILFASLTKNDDAKAKDILRTVKISSNDSKLIIVTHLPRAGLDRLLEANEKESRVWTF